MTDDALEVTRKQAEAWRQAHLVVAEALAWCLGYLEALGRDVTDRPFIKAALEGRAEVDA